jgi:predicted ATPase
MPYRILLTGAQGTGKSTLTRAIAASFAHEGIKGVCAFAGLGARVAQAGHRTGARAGAETVRMFADLHREREATAAGSILIFDRCLLDALAYAHVLQCLPADELESLQIAAVESGRRAAQFLWLRVTQDYPVTGPDDESPEFRRAIDAAIGSLARANDLHLRECALPPQRFDDIAREVTSAWQPAETLRTPAKRPT